MAGVPTKPKDLKVGQRWPREAAINSSSDGRLQLCITEEKKKTMGLLRQQIALLMRGRFRQRLHNVGQMTPFWNSSPVRPDLDVGQSCVNAIRIRLTIIHSECKDLESRTWFLKFMQRMEKVSPAQIKWYVVLHICIMFLLFITSWWDKCLRAWQFWVNKWQVKF